MLHADPQHDLRYIAFLNSGVWVSLGLLEVLISGFYPKP